MNNFKQGDDVIVTDLSYWGRKTVIWRCTFVRQEDSYFLVHTDEGEMSFSNVCGIKLVTT